MTRLHDLFGRERQSPWLDDLKRSYLVDGTLERRIAAGVRGITSNPTIMAKAISSSTDYDDQFARDVAMGMGVEDAYWELVIGDIEGALRLFAPLHEASGGCDGFVSLEVAPSLAHDAAGTVTSARNLHGRIGAPNLLVKVPATAEGVGAVEELVAEGRNVNVTLIFSLERYGQVVDAYLSGLERLAGSGGDLSRVASVASFFVSRVDTAVDRRLESLGARDGTKARAEAARALLGRAAVAQTKLAYALFTDRFASDRFAALAARGARVQRPLWASTSTKNPAYADLLYVDELIGPDTVSTMPAETLDAFLDHGRVARTVDSDVDDARATLEGLAELGVELDEVTTVLEAEGVEAFARSFDDLIASLAAKAEQLGAHT